jgi:RHS repeat-associated protein
MHCCDQKGSKLFSIFAFFLVFTCGAQSRLTNSIFPDGSSAQTIYNAIGKPAVTIDQQGRQTVMEYDELGRMTRTIYPDGNSDSSGYDAEGRRVSSTNRLGQVTRFDYDANGRLFRTVMPDGTSTTNWFDAAGQFLASTDARGVSTFYGYDAAGRSVAVTNALGEVSRSFYDAAGNLTNAVDALGRNTRFVYDELNRRVQTIFADGTTHTTWFDALGRRTHEQDQAGKVTAFGYDTLGRMTAVTNALGYVTSYAYDELGQQISQTDANQHTTTFEYDSLGRRVKRTLPGNQVETYAYNLGGLLTNKTDFNGYVTAFQYDVMNRLLAKIPDSRRGEANVTFGYNVLGLRTNMTDASGSTAYAYDDRNRLIEKTKTWAGAGLSVALAYSYDASGNLTNIVSSSANGVNVGYEYDALNRLNAVNDANVGRTAYSYDGVGNLRGYTYPNLVHTEHAYDALNRLTNLASDRLLTPMANYAYAVSASGNRTNATEQLFASVLNTQPKTINRVYQYDDVYRLTSESINGTPSTGSANYGYDPVGNRLSRGVSSLPLLPQTFSFDANDRLNADTYDANGNTLIGAGFDQFQPDQYDFENRLISRVATVNGQATTINIWYDGDGNRVKKSVTTATNSVTTFFVVDDQNPSGYAQVLEEITKDATLTTPAVTRVYTYGHTLISQDRLDGSQWTTSFYGYDGHNNVRYLTDLNGNVTDTYDYDAFGNVIAATGNTPNVYLFTGEQFDFDLGLYYLRARYHNPDSGRFWMQDSFAGFGSDPSSLHKYAYCGNNPVNCFDPSGRYSIAEMSISTGLYATARGIFGGTIGGLTGGLASGYDALLHGHVRNQEIAQAMTVGFKQGAIAGAFLFGVGSIGSIGQVGVSAVGMVYSGIGFLSAYQSYSSGNIEAGDFESAMAAATAVLSTPGLARGSVLGARGLTAALENYYGGPKNFINIQRVPMELANEGYPTDSAPYAGAAIEFETGKTQYFVRIIHIGNLDKPQGGFLTTAESVIGKSRHQLKQMFALRGDVVGFQMVKVPPGIRMRAGRVAAQPNWGEDNPGEAVQYQLLDENAAENFSGQIIPVNP